MKALIIVRHGNTFRPGETPTRVGSDTDLPLVEEERATFAGQWIEQHGYHPTKLLSAPLKRTRMTAEILSRQLSTPLSMEIDDRFIEIHYGPDENKTEDDVEYRLGALTLNQQGIDPVGIDRERVCLAGKAVIEAWNAQAILPPDWQADVPAIKDAWMQLAQSIQDGETVVVVSSNGTIRFAPVITGDYADFCSHHDLKVATGSVSVFTDQGEGWVPVAWNERLRKKKTI